MPDIDTAEAGPEPDNEGVSIYRHAYRANGIDSPGALPYRAGEKLAIAIAARANIPFAAIKDVWVKYVHSEKCDADRTMPFRSLRTGPVPRTVLL